MEEVPSLILPGASILVCYESSRLKEFEGKIGRVYSVYASIYERTQYHIEMPLPNGYCRGTVAYDGEIIKATKSDKFLYLMLGRVPYDERNKARVISKDSKAEAKVEE